MRYFAVTCSIDLRFSKGNRPYRAVKVFFGWIESLNIMNRKTARSILIANVRHKQASGLSLRKNSLEQNVRTESLSYIAAFKEDRKLQLSRKKAAAGIR